MKKNSKKSDEDLKKQSINSLSDSEKSRLALLNVLEDLEAERQQLIEAKAKDDAILASVLDGLVVSDPKGNFLFYNDVAARVVGLGALDVGKEKWSEAYGIFEPETMKPYPPESLPMVKALEGHVVEKSELFVRNPKMPNGVYISVNARPMKTPDGTIIGAVSTFRDVTKEKEIDKAKSEFVSLASHQLRTPLSAVNWYTEMLMDGDAGALNKEQQTFLDEIYKSNQRMIELVNSLLNVSRLDLGTFIIEPKATDIVEIVKDVMQEMKVSVLTKKMKVSEQYPKKVVLPLDSKLMRIVFQNLISNAVKYTPEKGTVTVAIERVKKGQTIGGKKSDAASVLFRVSDSGVGIPKHQQAQIFTKLFRADNARESVTDGTGLGLYIVKSIIEKSEGLVWFESKEGQGSTFYVMIPMEGMRKKEGIRALT